MKKYIFFAILTIVLWIIVTFYEYNLRDKFKNNHWALQEIANTGNAVTWNISNIYQSGDLKSNVITWIELSWTASTWASQLSDNIYKSLEENSESWYSKKANKVIYIDSYSNEEIFITWADTNTFKILSWDIIYWIDKNHVYINGGILSWADPQSFQLLFKKNYQEGDLSAYTKDKDNIYNEWKLLTGVDKNSFEVIDYFVNSDSCTYAFAKDKNWVYYFSDMLSWLDTWSFEFQEMWWDCESYIKDKNHSYKLSNSETGLDLKIIK